VHLFLVVMHLNGMLGGSILASGLATRALFALLPGLLLLVAFVGFLVQDPAIQQQVISFISELVPPLQGLIADSLQVISAGAVPFTVIGLVTLFWAASSFFQTLEVAFAVVLGIQRRRDPVIRGLIGVAGVGLVLAVVGVVIALLLISISLAPALAAKLFSRDYSQLAGFGLLAVVVITGTLLAYHFIPSIRPSWGAVAVPAVVVGLVVTALTELFTLIAPYLAGVASLYGAIAAVFVLLAWLQLASNAIVLGMAWIRVRVHGEPPSETMAWPTGTLNRPPALDAVPAAATTASPPDRAD
jgi:YihY family inner membrane protein